MAEGIQVKPFTVEQPGEAERSLEQSYRQESESLRARTAPIKEDMGRVEGEMRDITKSIPEAPKLQEVPQFQPQRRQGDELMLFAGIAMALSAIGAKQAGGDIALAMNTAGSAMEGFAKGDHQRIKTDIETFNTQVKSIKDNNEQMLKEYQAVLQDKRLTLQQKMQEYNVIANKYQDELAMSAIRKGDLKFELDRLDKVRSATNQFGMRAEQIRATMEARLQHEQTMRELAQLRATTAAGRQANSGLSDTATNYLAAYVQLNGRMPIGFSRQNPMAIDTMNVLAESAKKAGLSAEEWAAAGPVTRQKLGALMQLEKNRNAIQAYEGMLDLNIDILKDLSKDVTRTDSPYLNRPILWLANNAKGDPAVAQYLFQVNTVSTEIARILNNPNMTGQLTDTARQELEGVVSGNFNPEQLNAVLNRAQADARNRSRTLDKQVDKVIGEIRDPLHRSGGAGSEIKRITSDAEYNALPSGTEFIDPTGKKRRKP